MISSVIDLFSLYVLFSHFRPRDATRGNSFFQMSSYARANVRITNDRNKRKIPMRASRGLKWENKMYKLKRSIALIFVSFDSHLKTSGVVYSIHSQWIPYSRREQNPYVGKVADSKARVSAVITILDFLDPGT